MKNRFFNSMINLKNYIYIAFSFLTIIKLPQYDKLKFNEKNIQGSLIFFPLVGFFFGITSYLLAFLLFYLRMNPVITGFFISLLPYLLNKFLHFDGLCDCFDAFFSDRSRKERLKILKDSRVGSFALGASIFFIFFKIIIVTLFMTNKNLIKFLIFIPLLSRYSLVILSYISRYPRNKGTAFFIVGRINKKIFGSATSVFLIILSIILMIFKGFRMLDLFFFFSQLHWFLSLVYL